MSTTSEEAPTAGIRSSLSKATKTALSFSAGCLRNLLPGFAPISLQWFSLYLSFSNVCKATTVTHTKRIDRNLLRFVISLHWNDCIYPINQWFLIGVSRPQSRPWRSGCCVANSNFISLLKCRIFRTAHTNILLHASYQIRNPNRFLWSSHYLRYNFCPVSALHSFNRSYRRNTPPLEKANAAHMGVGRIFSRWGAVGNFLKIFSRGGQKWWNLVFTPRNWKNDLFLLIISKSWVPRSPCPPFPTPMAAQWCWDYVSVVNICPSVKTCQLKFQQSATHTFTIIVLYCIH